MPASTTKSLKRNGKQQRKSNAIPGWYALTDGGELEVLSLRQIMNGTEGTAHSVSCGWLIEMTKEEKEGLTMVGLY